MGMNFILIFITSCTVNFDCIHEIKLYDTYAECEEAQMEYQEWDTECYSIRNIEFLEELK